MWINKTKFLSYIKSLNISKNYEIDNIVSEILKNDGLNDFEILDVFDKEKKRFLIFIKDYIEEFLLLKLIPPFEIKWDSKYLFWILNSKSSILNKEQKERYLFKDKLIEWLKNVTPEQFENFCSFILKEIYDFEISNITKFSKDWWIDFFWHYKIKNKPINLFEDLPIYIYWQAKQYSNKIQEKDINQFSAVRKKIIEGRDERFKKSLPKEYTSEPYLSLPVFITTSSYTKWAIETAKIFNIMLKDLDMIVNDIILKWNDSIFKNWKINLNFL